MTVAYQATLLNNTVTASGDTSATPVTTRHCREGIFYLDITSVSGSSPTLDLTFKVYDEVSAKWFELASFDRKTTTCTDVGYIQFGLDGKVALFYTVGGTNPSFTLTVSVHLKEG